MKNGDWPSSPPDGKLIHPVPKQERRRKDGVDAEVTLANLCRDLVFLSLLPGHMGLSPTWDNTLMRRGIFVPHVRYHGGMKAK